MRKKEEISENERRRGNSGSSWRKGGEETGNILGSRVSICVPPCLPLSIMIPKLRRNSALGKSTFICIDVWNLGTSEGKCAGVKR